ncbi:putative cyclin [Dioscorea sansibarensis]
MTGGEPFHQDADLGDFGSRWYFSRREIEENSPSRKDGIDLKKETYLRKSYCTFLQDLGIRLKVPQVTIATAIVLCHRFFLRQSHAKNDRRTIATVCMFLAGKAEETPRPLKDVILVSYEIMHKKDPLAVQRIKQKEVCDQQKELIQLAERVVLSTLGFDLNVHHPYKPLVEAIKKFKVAQNALAQVAWNFVNDGLRTSLCLQFKPHHIAAGAIFLAAKFLKVKLPSDGEKFWWQEFDVTPRQLEDVSNQMLELYEQSRPVQASHANEVEGSTSGGTNQTVVMSSTINENPPSTNVRSHASEAPNTKQGVRVPQSAKLSAPPTASDFQTLPQSSSLTHENASSEVFDRKMDNDEEDCLHNEVGQHGCRSENMAGASIHSSSLTDRHARGMVTSHGGEAIETRERKDDAPASISKLDRNKFKAAFERRRKQGSDVSTETNLMDEDDLIEREIEKGIELAVEDEKLKQEKRTGWPKPLNYAGLRNQNVNPEEGELSSFSGSERAPSKWHHDLPHQSRDAGGRSFIENSGRDRKRLRHDSHA